MGLFGLGRPDVSRLAAARNVSGLIAASQYGKDPSVRTAAVDALGRLGDPLAFDALATALADANVLVRLAAVDALGRLRDSRAVEPLGRILRQRDPVLSQTVMAALAASGPAAVPVLVTALADDDSRIRQLASDHLAGMGVEAVAPLVASLSTVVVPVRAGVAGVLGRLADARGLDALVGLLSDLDEQVRVEAVDAIGKLAMQPGGSTALPALVARLNDASAAVRNRAAQALAGTRDASVVGALVATVAQGTGTTATLDAVAALDPLALLPFMEAQSEVRLALERVAREDAWPDLLRAIGALGGAESFRVIAGILSRMCLAAGNIMTVGEFLLRSANWVDNATSAAALDALLAIGTRTNTTPPLALHLQFSAVSADGTARITRALDQIAERHLTAAVEPLLALAAASRGSDGYAAQVLPGLDWHAYAKMPELRRRALQIVGEFIGPEAAAEAWWAEDRGWRGEADILWDTVGVLGHGAGPLLLRLASPGHDAAWRAHAIALLDELQIPGSQPIFEQAFADANSDVNRAAALALAGLGDEALPFLAPRLTDPSWGVRKRAATALVRIKTPPARAVLDDLKKTEQDVEILRILDGE
jgi:HEAT repeat protein